MSRLVIFLDDGGVMNDNTQRGPQWRRLVAEFFTPLLGGTPEAWSEANRTMSDQLFDPVNWQKRIQAASDYASFDRRYQLDWLAGMCEFVGVPTPPEEEYLELAYRATAFIISRVRADFPGAIDAVRTLHSQGYTLHTASNGCSRDLNSLLNGMGIRDCFGRLYGPDLVNAFKLKGPEYYERIFADLGISPTDALVVDDSSRAISLAAQTGARTVLVNNSFHQETAGTLQIKSLAELPQMIHRLD
ncbi:MAG TPA: HAD family hydrolase [Ktedonobacteraceae bacterium]|nr:HAD family hydrolase [Ktedonobacteraceae bacterium]